MCELTVRRLTKRPYRPGRYERRGAVSFVKSIRSVRRQRGQLPVAPVQGDERHIVYRYASR
jgi:hypothetical protein